ncbi:MAG TPA: hypothetical protein DEA47_05585 [Peptococcaceae bacterium]|nr:hypothetical protein [Peptococcaceae bacterium]
MLKKKIIQLWSFFCIWNSCIPKKFLKENKSHHRRYVKIKKATYQKSLQGNSRRALKEVLLFWI